MSGQELEKRASPDMAEKLRWFDRTCTDSGARSSIDHRESSVYSGEGVPNGWKEVLSMVSRIQGMRALAVLAGLVLAGGPSLADAAPNRDLVPIASRYSYAAGAEDLVLEVRVSGGFGKMLGHVFRLYGDGRLEEILVWSDDRAATPSERALPFPAASRDRFLGSLVAAGVPGATHDSLVADLQARDSRFKDLIWGSDCLHVHFRLALFEQKSAEEKPSEVVTELDLECTYKYREIYSSSKPLVTLAASIDELLALSEAEGWE